MIMQTLDQGSRSSLRRTGWNSRLFSDRIIEAERLRCLLEAANQTPSHRGEQPWSFIVAMKHHGDEHERLLACLSEGDAAWARRAPVLIIPVAKLAFDHDGEPNVHAFRDVRRAISNFTLRSKAMGLIVHEIAAFDGGRIREQFHIPGGCVPVAAIAVGYPVEVSVPDVTEASAIARPLDIFVFTGTWGQPFPFAREPHSERGASEFGCKDSVRSMPALSLPR